MTLSWKIILSVFLAIFTLGVALFAAYAAIQLRSYAALEQQDTNQHLQRTVNSLSALLAQLDSKANDWAHWDELVSYMAGEAPAVAAENVHPVAMQSLRLDFLLIVDEQGAIRFGYGYDHHRAQPIALSAAWPAFVAAHRSLFAFDDIRQGVTGIAMLPEGPAIFAARPILNAQGDPPAHGYVIMGDALDADLVNELATTVELPLALYYLPDKDLPAAVQAAARSLTPASPFAVRPVNRSMVAGYALLTDVDGGKNLALRVEQPRSIYQQGEQGVLTFLLVLLLIGVILGAIILYQLRWLVLKPVAQLEVGVERVAAGELTYRIPVLQRDEIGKLAAAFNSMAIRLYEREQQLQAATADLYALNADLEARITARTGELVAEVEERRRIQDDLQSYAVRLERSNRELQDFAYVSSHDLQEPLRKIQAFGDLLRETNGAALDAMGVSYLQRIQNAAARMSMLIEGLLNYSRVTTKARPFEATNLQVVAGEVISDLESRIAASQAEVTVGVLPVIDADPLQMRQLLQNLIANALKFQPPNAHPVVTVNAECLRMSLPCLPEDTQIDVCQLRVVDNGIGFDEKYAERIFQVFQRLHARGEYEGAGIGLSICRKIVERHGGVISVHSAFGQGATFLVTLPLIQSPGAN